MISIDVWSDLLCPFCYIGKRHLERALAAAPDVDATVRWRSFQLDPAADRVSALRNDERLAKKYGRSVGWARRMHQEITRRGAAVGVAFDFDAVRADAEEARALGLTGVPFFLFDRRLAISGAQPVDVFLEALRQSA